MSDHSKKSAFVVCDCSGSLMLNQLNTTKLNKIIPTLKRTQVYAYTLRLYTSQAISNVVQCSGKGNMWRVFKPKFQISEFYRNTKTSCSSVKLRDLKFGFELHQNAFGSRALPGPAGEGTAIFTCILSPVTGSPSTRYHKVWYGKTRMVVRFDTIRT